MPEYRFPLISFFSIKAESTTLSLYGNTARENPYSGIFYAVKSSTNIDEKKIIIKVITKLMMVLYIIYNMVKENAIVKPISYSIL